MFPKKIFPEIKIFLFLWFVFLSFSEFELFRILTLPDIIFILFKDHWLDQLRIKKKNWFKIFYSHISLFLF